MGQGSPPLGQGLGGEQPEGVLGGEGGQLVHRHGVAACFAGGGCRDDGLPRGLVVLGPPRILRAHITGQAAAAREAPGLPCARLDRRDQHLRWPKGAGLGRACLLDRVPGYRSSRCGFATYFVQVYSAPALDPYVLQHDEVEMSLWIDDFTCQVEDQREDRLLHKLAAAADDLYNIIVQDLEAEVSFPKAAVVASSPALLKKAKRVLGHLGGEAVASAEALGIDLVAGKRRRAFKTRSVLARRLEKLKRRARRTARLKQAGKGRPARLFASGLGPATWYGMAIYGADRGELHDLQAAALSLFTPRACGRDRAATLLVNGDPCWRAAVAPLHRWAQEVWGSLLAGPVPSRFLTLAQLLRLHAAALASPPRSWAEVRGPAGACKLSAERLGWTWTGAFEFLTDLGARLVLTEVGPKEVEHAARAAYFRRLELQVAKRAGLQEGSRASLRHLSTLLHRRGEKAYPQKVFQGAKVVACDAVWTGEKLAKYFHFDPACPHCGEVESWQHRVLRCPAADTLRQEFLDPATLAFLQEHPARLWGLFEAPSSFV